jgi:hypothetical protein
MNADFFKVLPKNVVLIMFIVGFLLSVFDY